MAGAGSNSGFTLMITLTTISFLGALNGFKVDPKRFKVNFNTFAMVVGQTGSGKSPTTNVNLKDPFESMEGDLGNYAINVPAVNSLLYSLRDGYIVCSKEG